MKFYIETRSGYIYEALKYQCWGGTIPSFSFTSWAAGASSSEARLNSIFNEHIKIARHKNKNYVVTKEKKNIFYNNIRKFWAEEE